MVGRNSRWFWEISKSYEDINVMIHLAVAVNLIRTKSITNTTIRGKIVLFHRGFTTLPPQLW